MILTVNDGSADRLVALINNMKKGVDSHTPDTLLKVSKEYGLVSSYECVKNMSPTELVSHSCDRTSNDVQ